MFNPTLTIIKKYAVDFVCAVLLVSLVLVSCSNKNTEEEDKKTDSGMMTYSPLFFCLSEGLNEKCPIDTTFQIYIEIPRLYAKYYETPIAKLTVSDTRFMYYDPNGEPVRELVLEYDMTDDAHSRVIPVGKNEYDKVIKKSRYTEMISFQYNIGDDTNERYKDGSNINETCEYGKLEFNLKYDFVESANFGDVMDAKVRIFFATDGEYIAFSDVNFDDARQTLGLKPIYSSNKRSGCAVG